MTDAGAVAVVDLVCEQKRSQHNGHVVFKTVWHWSCGCGKTGPTHDARHNALTGGAEHGMTHGPWRIGVDRVLPPSWRR